MQVYPRRVDEQKTLGEVLTAHLEDAAKYQLLRSYREAGLEKLHVLMRREHSPVRGGQAKSTCSA